MHDDIRLTNDKYILVDTRLYFQPDSVANLHLQFNIVYHNCNMAH